MRERGCGYLVVDSHMFFGVVFSLYILKLSHEHIYFQVNISHNCLYIYIYIYIYIYKSNEHITVLRYENAFYCSKHFLVTKIFHFKHFKILN